MGKWAIILGVGSLLLTGCSDKPPPRTENPDKSNLRRIGQAMQLSENLKNRPPLNETELKHWLGELGEKDPPEAFLISRRDAQPFHIVYGVPLDLKLKDVIVAHEMQGVGGTRFVLTQSGNVRELSNEGFSKATIAKPKGAKATN